MRARLEYCWYLVSSSLWLVPGLMITGAALLASGTLGLDALVAIPWLAGPQATFRIGPEGSRLLLSTIAGSMVTVASLVFSITLIALQLASSQFGPRLITRFMQDRVNQVVLGTFVATFLYALLVLGTVGTGEEPFVPHLSILVALLLTVVSLGWLIFFIHHVAETIQADTVIADVSRELLGSIGTRFPGRAARAGRPGASPVPERPSTGVAPIAFEESGYIQAIDVEALLATAVRRDLLIDLDCRPGHFVVAGVPLAWAWPDARTDDHLPLALRRAIVLGHKRTPTQDLEFAIGMLVGIALRALSPGINDPLTAVTCVDRLGAALAELMRRPEPPTAILGDDGTCRLILHPTTFEDALDVAFDDVRQAARGQVRVLIRLADVLTPLAGLATGARQRDAIAAQAEAVARSCRESIADPADRADAEARLALLRRVLESA